jgi:hypothetical protein
MVHPLNNSESSHRGLTHLSTPFQDGSNGLAGWMCLNKISILVHELFTSDLRIDWTGLGRICFGCVPAVRENLWLQHQVIAILRAISRSKSWKTISMVLKALDWVSGISCSLGTREKQGSITRSYGSAMARWLYQVATCSTTYPNNSTSTSQATIITASMIGKQVSTN